MNLRAIASAIILTLPMSTSFADNSDKLICKPITATLPKLTSDSSCTISSYKDSYFPDLTFLGIPNSQLAPYYCFTTTLTNATIGGVTVTGTAFSGLTNSDQLYGALTAATVINFKDARGQQMGTLFTHDVIVLLDPLYIEHQIPNPTAIMERLVQVDGTRLFKGGKGNLTINGSAVSDQTTLTGTLCADD
jgi:hypothetical protein